MYCGSGHRRSRWVAVRAKDDVQRQGILAVRVAYGGVSVNVSGFSTVITERTTTRSSLYVGLVGGAVLYAWCSGGRRWKALRLDLM